MNIEQSLADLDIKYSFIYKLNHNTIVQHYIIS